MLQGGEPVIDVQGLRVRRGHHLALRDLTLAIRRGSITGLLGPSGSGKTTLMRAIVGTQIVEAGSVHVLGLPAGSADLRRRIGYMTQDASVYGDLSVMENARYFAVVSGRTTADADRAIDTVGLRRLRRQRVDTLSGGERNRVSLACALVGSPEVLVLDEPTVGLDPILRAELWRAFATLRERGVTILVSSHVMSEADRCERIVMLRDGSLVGVMTSTELRRRGASENPEDAFLNLIERREAGEA